MHNPASSNHAPDHGNVPDWLGAVASELIDGEIGPIELAERSGLTLIELAQWASARNGARLLEGLARLAELRARMVIARYRATAAASLIEMATRNDGSETARKACVDLLRLTPDITPPPSSPDAGATNGGEPAGLPAPSEAAILEALEALGAAE